MSLKSNGSPPFVLRGGGDTPLVVDQFNDTRINTLGGEPKKRITNGVVLCLSLNVKKLLRALAHWRANP